ncbi:hypothetical protein FDP41_000452 [Naegleria fowleri]|uniref:Uncharacterized protein n=1 Tax=Naegleria fowleri TaxID=5763 RepID=A0A6A5C2A3_NAEFO|nr:uncharacterized protein FDP41_000452 [Naegleria fowleri]KAF0984553.1 hypothetical protein FDP41_000452 [Naegleria fowleri]CAG4713334.1 unnamed protein product [Naegleria fowleri]
MFQANDDREEEPAVVIHLDDHCPIGISNPKFQYQFNRRKFQKETIPFSLETCSDQIQLLIPRPPSCILSEILIATSTSMNIIMIIEKFDRAMFLFNLSTKKLEKQFKVKDYGVFLIEENYDGIGHDACIVTCKADVLPRHYSAIEQYQRAGLLIAKYDLHHFISEHERNLTPTPLWVSSTLLLPIQLVCVQYNKDLLNKIYGVSRIGQVLVLRSSNGSILFKETLKWHATNKYKMSILNQLIYGCFINDGSDLLIATRKLIGIFSCQIRDGLLQFTLKIEIAPKILSICGICYESSTNKLFISEKASTTVQVYNTLNGQLLQSLQIPKISESHSGIKIIEHTGELAVLDPCEPTLLQLFK